MIDSTIDVAYTKLINTLVIQNNYDFLIFTTF